MGFIEATYTRTMLLLDSLGQSQFEAVASQLGGTAQILSALMVVLVLINMSLQFRPMEAGTSIWLIFKFALFALFMKSWTDFNGVFNAVESGFEVIGNALLAGGIGAGQTSASFPQELDNLSGTMSTYANVTAGRLNILGGMINALMFLAISIFGALATLAMVASRVVLAVLIGIAPFAILATLTIQTKGYFDTWLSGVIKVLMFPLILIGIFATILGMGNATISSIDPDNITTIGQVTPILTVLVLASFLVVLSPLIVTLVTGDFALGAVTAVLSSKLGGAARSSGRSVGAATSGLVGGARGREVVDGESRSSRAGNALGGGVRNAASAVSPSNLNGNLLAGVEHRAAQINRASERVARLKRK